jgi:competence protein ComEC
LDEIQRKLAEIDRRLAASPAGYFKQIISTAPLLFCAIGLMVGIILQNFAAMAAWVWLTMLGLCVAATFVSLVIRDSWLVRGVETSHILAYLTLICFGCVGAIRLASFYQPGENDIRNFLGGERQLATIRGTIVTKPYASDNPDWAFAKFKFADSGSSFYLKVTEVETINGWAKASGVVRVQVDEPVVDLSMGDFVQLYCWLEGFEGASNPGEFDIAQYLARKRVFIGAAVKTRDGIELLGNRPAGIFAKTKARLRQAAVQALLCQRYPNEESEKLLLALVLGYRADIDKTILEAFRKTGLLHFICLSGMNFGILIGIVWWICKTIGLMKPGRAVVCLLTAVLFLLVVPENAPAFRAAVMCFAFCGSIFFRRRVNPFNSLALAAIVLLLIKPTGLFDAGWQLSFASVLGILLLSERINRFINDKATDWFGRGNTLRDSRLSQVVVFFGSLVSAGFAVSLAAWSASAGILLYHFGTIQPMTSIWTVIVSPLIAVISVAGYVKLVLAVFVPSIANAMDILIMPLSDFLIWLVKFIASWDISQILIGCVPVVLIILYYGLIAFAAFAYFRRPTPKRVICTVIIICIAGWAGILKWERTHRDDLAISVLDVGHGQAILAQLPGTTNILFDTGSLARSDIGRRVVIPFLQYNGIGKLDAVVLSHGDIDHINGIPEVMSDYRTGFVYASNAFFEDKRQTTGFLRDELKQKNIAARKIDDLPQMVGPATVKVLWPDKDVLENDGVSDNDKSIVTMIEYAGRRILLSSDIEKFAQKEILRLYPGIKADIVIAPHHGSAKTTEPAFLETLSPDILISSCGRSAVENKLVIDPQGDIRGFYTARDGEVTVRVDRNGKIEAESFVRK